MSADLRPGDEEPLPSEMVGGYRIVRRLGDGGMGCVYEALEPAIERRVAVKVLRRRLADDPDFVQRFHREARVLAGLRHPAIVDAFAFGHLEDGRPYFVMSLLEGESVRAHLDRSRRLSAARAWSITRQVADALGAAHGAGLVHRDLKPDNVFLERIGSAEHVRVMDFGIAKDVGDAAQRSRSGVILGTPAYMAPEQWWGARLDASVDQYALGVMLFEMISGEPPFDPRHEAGVMKLHLHEAPPKLADRGILVSPAIEEFLRRLLQKEPADRFEDMAAVIEAGDAAFASATTAGNERDGGSLEQAATVAATTAPGATEPAIRPFRRWLVAHVACGLLAPALLFAVGYAGSLRWNPLMWFRLAGWAAYPCVASYLIALAALPWLGRSSSTTERSRVVQRLLVVAPGMIGALGTYIDWEAVTRYVSTLEATKRFRILNQGAFEAGTSRFIGFGLAVGLCLSLAALQGLPARRSATKSGAPRWVAPSLLIGFVLLAVLSVLFGAPSAGYVAAVAALFVLASLALPLDEDNRSALVERSVAGLLAVLFASGAALERVSARQGIVWTEQSTRSGRIAEIVAAASERNATLVVVVAVVAVVAAAELLRLRAIGGAWKAARPHLALLVLLALGVSGDLVLAHRFDARRDSARASLQEQFALFAELDPPSTKLLDARRFEPHEGPALQITRAVVAVNGQEISRLNAVSHAVGRTRVENALFGTLARAAEAPLSCLIDRRVRWAEARRVLALAYAAGATDTELLMTRGPAPSFLPTTPPEASYVETKDFVAVHVVLGRTGRNLDGNKSYGKVAAGLIADARAGRKIELSVGPPAGGRNSGHAPAVPAGIPANGRP